MCSALLKKHADLGMWTANHLLQCVYLFAYADGMETQLQTRQELHRQQASFSSLWKHQKRFRKVRIYHQLSHVHSAERRSNNMDQTCGASVKPLCSLIKCHEAFPGCTKSSVTTHHRTQTDNFTLNSNMPALSLHEHNCMHAHNSRPKHVDST